MKTIYLIFYEQDCMAPRVVSVVDSKDAARRIVRKKYEERLRLIRENRIYVLFDSEEYTQDDVILINYWDNAYGIEKEDHLWYEEHQVES